MYRLIFQTGRHAGRSLAVRQSVLVVGRAPECHLSFPEEASLSARHFRIEENQAGVFVCTLDPDSLLKVNGDPLLGDRPLHEGDILEVGATRMRFSEGRGERGVREERRRLALKGKVSHGVIQPMGTLLTLGLALGEILLVWLLFIWPQVWISPETEAADLARAEAIRAQQAAETNTVAAATQPAPGPATTDGGGTAVADATPTGTSPATPPSGATSLPAPTAPQAAKPTSVVATPTDLSPEMMAARAAAQDAAAALAANPDADLSAETNATVAALALLQDADFEPASPVTPLSELPPLSNADPRIADAQRLLAQADAAAQFADYDEALRIVEGLHASAPGFLPAYEMHARILEARGQLNDALVRWRQLKGLAPADSTFQTTASDGIERMQKAIELSQAAPVTVPAPDAATARATIRKPEVQKLPTDDDDDLAEMRVLSTAIDIEAGSSLRPGDRLDLFIEFFDRTTAGDILPSRAMVQGSPLERTVPGGTGARSIPVDNYTYVVPRSLLARDRTTTTVYYGYRIRLYSGTNLLDAVAKPRKLLELAIPATPAPAPAN